MSARCLFRLAPLRVTAAAVTLITFAAVPASAAATRVAAPAPRPAIRHFNVGQAHSPQLLRELAAAASGPATAPGGPAPRVGSVLGTASAVPAGSLTGAVQGVDVASYQEAPTAISWSKVAAAGIQFAAIKATEGQYYVNPYASADLSAAKAAGLAVLAYAFAIPNGGGASSSATAQADYLIAQAGGPDGQAPSFMLDIEYDPYTSSDHTNECYGLSPLAMQDWISAFGSEVMARTGRLPILYTTQDWWQTCTGGSTALSQFPLWAADYTTAPGPALPTGWSTWNLWQYTSTGTVSGIATIGHTDLDQLNPAAVTILSPGNQVAAAGSVVSLQLRGSAPGLSFTASGLPAGLTLNSVTGKISGPAQATGAYRVAITATDPTSLVTASVSFTWYVHGTLLITSPATRKTVGGHPVDFRVQASDSVTGQQPSFTATRLPPGVSITTAGQVVGWPGGPGTYQVTVTGRDSLEAVGTASFSWTVTKAPNSGPAGPVRSALAGKCLNDIGNQSASGTGAEVWPCNGGAAQHWTYVQDGTLRIHGRCLTAPGSSPVSGTRTGLEACTGAPRQQWQPAYPRAISPSLGASPTTLINSWSKMCLADPARATGTRVVIRTCAGSAAQSWTLPAGPLRSQVPGKCLEDSGNRTVSGNKIVIWACNGTMAEAWTLEPDGTARLHGKCLGVRGQAAASGTPVSLYSCTGAGSQLWHLTPDGAGLMLVNPGSGLCLTDPSAARANGTPLDIAACAALAGKVWRAS
jgi:GH25 family lysozyme M1 (1,4-beta-N-acetylmuramidase)